MEIEAFLKKNLRPFLRRYVGISLFGALDTISEYSEDYVQVLVCRPWYSTVRTFILQYMLWEEALLYVETIEVSISPLSQSSEVNGM